MSGFWCWPFRIKERGSSVCITIQQSYRGKKAETQFSSLKVTAVKCSTVAAWVFICCLSHMKYSALCDVLIFWHFDQLGTAQQHILPITFLDWNMDFPPVCTQCRNPQYPKTSVHIRHIWTSGFTFSVSLQQLEIL